MKVQKIEKDGKVQKAEKCEKIEEISTEVKRRTKDAESQDKSTDDPNLRQNERAKGVLAGRVNERHGGWHCEKDLKTVLDELRRSGVS